MCPTKLLAHSYAVNVGADDELKGYQGKEMNEALEEMEPLCEAQGSPPGPLIFLSGCGFPGRSHSLHGVGVCIMDSPS